MKKLSFALTIVFVIGAVIAAVGVAFNAFIGMPSKEYQQVVTRTAAPIQAGNGMEMPIEIERDVAVPGRLPLSPLVHRTPATNIEVAMPQLIVPKPLIVREPKSTRRGGPSR